MVGPEPDVVVAVVFMRNVDRDTLSVLAWIEDLKPVRVVDAGLGWAGPASRRRR